VEVGVGFLGGTVSGVLGGKYFLASGLQGGFVAGRALVIPVYGAIGYGGILTGGYRFAFNALQLDVEAGGGVIAATNGSQTASAFAPAFGLSVGYRF